ncbi:WhiB family transcriptional regulator [Streptomyces sp. NPDC058676]|uniref:WhiB family transcriptional regulator n=1 Tax=Streptomyces sp. NPDC058676 TaxID=3346593 RepID=UPI0036631667
MDREWELKAACKSEDPDVFFSSKSVGLARQICHDCPVRMECLESAIVREARVAKEFRTGIVAGLTGAQRWAIDQQRKAAAKAEGKASAVKPRGPGRKPSPCGTRAAYQRHIRKGEPVDQACKDAHALGNREYRRTGSTQVPAAR